MLWQNRTWTELPADLRAAQCAAVVPVGATEQHGPHLGTDADYLLSDLLCRAVAQRTLVPMLPGCSLGHGRRWPGTLAARPVTLIKLVEAIGERAFHIGVRRRFIVNTHVTNAAPLRCALEMPRAERDAPVVALINAPEISEPIGQAHCANAAETSLMRAVAPQPLRAGLAGGRRSGPYRRAGVCTQGHRTSTNGVTGLPALPRPRSEMLFAWMVEDLGAMIVRGPLGDATAAPFVVITRSGELP